MNRTPRPIASACVVIALAAGTALADPIPATRLDFQLPGTQPGMIPNGTLLDSANCRACHGNISDNDPYATWSGSLMGQAARDPLFYAQMTLANQDVANAGEFCLRCHVPNAQVSGHVQPPDGTGLTTFDMDGVSCHMCHSMVDPIYNPATSPSVDQQIIAALGPLAPQYYGNAMFVLDPTGLRRGPRAPAALHDAVRSDFFTSSNMCGTCHEVGNVATIKQPDGTYRYNPMNQAPDDLNPAHQFPLERTFSEWRLSSFAAGGVDMGGRFGGVGVTVVSSCQSCHMPRVADRSCIVGPNRPDMARHDFAGASAQVLDIIAAYTANDPAVSQLNIAKGRAKAVDMLKRAASLSATQAGETLTARVTNESGHKLPTGHIEGRRVWLNVRFTSALGDLVGEYGAYHGLTADLDADTTTVFEMHVGLDGYAAAVTGFPAGPTGRMSLANTIVKDNRIPPRGFNNAAFEAAG
ncbi:MAG: multiheme c-type cytochrome, partial [Phycisphaerales bacterium]|nr:multiheme c-type cytochrome [Phycisphaerales bacterium]